MERKMVKDKIDLLGLHGSLRQDLQGMMKGLNIRKSGIMKGLNIRKSEQGR